MKTSSKLRFQLRSDKYYEHVKKYHIPMTTTTTTSASANFGDFENETTCELLVVTYCSNVCYILYWTEYMWLDREDKMDELAAKAPITTSRAEVCELEFLFPQKNCTWTENKKNEYRYFTFITLVQLMNWSPEKFVKLFVFWFSITSDGNCDHHSVTRDDDSSWQLAESVAPREKSFQRRKSAKQNGHRRNARNVLGHESSKKTLFFQFKY